MPQLLEPLRVPKPRHRGVPAACADRLGGGKVVCFCRHAKGCLYESRVCRAPPRLSLCLAANDDNTMHPSAVTMLRDEQPRHARLAASRLGVSPN